MRGSICEASDRSGLELIYYRAMKATGLELVTNHRKMNSSAAVGKLVMTSYERGGVEADLVIDRSSQQFFSSTCAKCLIL